MQRFLQILIVAVGAIAALTALNQVAPAFAQGQGKYAVVVNASNAYGEDDAKMMSTIRQLFLKDRGEWPGGEESRPFAVKKDTDEHKAFLSTVLQMSESELAQHWIGLKQRTGQTPPREVGSARLVGKLIGKYAGAFSVMTADAAASTDGVKVLFLFD